MKPEEITPTTSLILSSLDNKFYAVDKDGNKFLCTDQEQAEMLIEVNFPSDIIPIKPDHPYEIPGLTFEVKRQINYGSGWKFTNPYYFIHCQSLPHVEKRIVAVLSLSPDTGEKQEPKPSELPVPIPCQAIVGLSIQDSRRLFKMMCDWERSGLVDYSLMKGFDYIQRKLALNIQENYTPHDEKTPDTGEKQEPDYYIKDNEGNWIIVSKQLYDAATNSKVDKRDGRIVDRRLMKKIFEVSEMLEKECKTRRVQNSEQLLVNSNAKHPSSSVLEGDKKEDAIWDEVGEKVKNNQWFAGDLYNYLRRNYSITKKSSLERPQE